jgi:cytochrome c553
MKERFHLFTAALICAGLSFTAQAAGDAQKGEAIAAACVECHGANGKAVNPAYPHLAGQKEAYLVRALKAYKDKAWTSELAIIMHAPAAELSDEDIANLAAYYSRM